MEENVTVYNWNIGPSRALVHTPTGGNYEARETIRRNKNGRSDMPLYHFNVYHDVTTHDLRGMELPNREAAWKQATMVAGDKIKDIDGKLKPGHDWRMEVTDEFENPLWELNVNAEKK